MLENRAARNRGSLNAKPVYHIWCSCVGQDSTKSSVAESCCDERSVELQVLIQFEGHRSLSWDIDLLPLVRVCAPAPAAPPANSSNGCSLAAAGNGTDQSSGECAASNILRGALFLPTPSLPPPLWATAFEATGVYLCPLTVSDFNASST